MRIEQFQSSTSNNRARASAQVIWEDSAQAPLEVFFETESRFADSLCSNLNAFLVAALVPAIWAGEKRIHVAGKICPQLLENLENAVGLLLHWYGDFRPPIQIESEGSAVPQTSAPRHAGVFLSGGLDSLFTLRDNRLRYPREHPSSIRYGILVYGFDMGHTPGKDDLAVFGHAREALLPVTEETGIELVPLTTNLRQLNNDLDFWVYNFHGAALGAVAHALSGMLDRAYIASSETGFGSISPWGSHPLLDPLYSSHAVQIVHHGMRYSRLDKTRVVGDWPTGLNSLRVCYKNIPGKLNCGLCEKCIRTRLMLLAVGKLGACKAFDIGDITVEQMRHISTEDPAVIDMYRSLVGPLNAVNRPDLAAASEEVANRSLRYLGWLNNTGGSIKARLKRLDRRILGGKVFKVYSKLFP